MIGVSVLYHDPLSSSVVTLCASAAVWFLTVRWNPYVSKLTENTARSANTVILTLQV
jgi:hypothetical protein